MAGESESRQRRWLVEPLEPLEIRFQIEAGDQVEVSPEIRQAFDNFVDSLGSEVEGYAKTDCPYYKPGCSSNTFACIPRRTCTFEVQKPCLIDYRCSISPTPG